MKTTTSAEGFEEYCRLNAFKYIWRANNKENKVQDIKKAIWYLRMSIGDDLVAVKVVHIEKSNGKSLATITTKFLETEWYAE